MVSYRIKPFVDTYKLTDRSDLISAWDAIQIGYAGSSFTEETAVKVIKRSLGVGEKDATNIFYALLHRGIVEVAPGEAPSRSLSEHTRKVLICGDRNWSDIATIRSWIAKLQDWGYDTLIEGEAPGADSIARNEAERAGFTIMESKPGVKGFPADWTRYGRAAGPIRNRQMLDQKPDLVLAFHNDLTQSTGTADTVREATRRGMAVIVVTSTGVDLRFSNTRS